MKILENVNGKEVKEDILDVLKILFFSSVGVISMSYPLGFILSL